MPASWRPPSPAVQSQLPSLVPGVVLGVLVQRMALAVGTVQWEWKGACRRPQTPVSTCLHLLL